MASRNADDVVAMLQRALPGLLAVYWFGSRARGCATPDSDWDLAVLVPGYADAATLWDLAQQLAVDLGHDVDLLDMRAATTVMQHQVLTTGRRLWGVEPEASLYEAFIASEKLELDRRRGPLLRDIEAEGRIHGR
jgi:predicted nucleotidyltransferase